MRSLLGDRHNLDQNKLGRSKFISPALEQFEYDFIYQTINLIN